METRDEVLVFGCRDNDLAVLAEAFGRTGPVLRAVTTAAEFAQHAVSRRRLAVVLGVGLSRVAHLDLIPVIRAVRSSLPVIVVADEDSLELERSAREKNIFYYLVHPIEKSEVEAVLKDVVRRAEG
jgi:DNA-binding response OmpR family regulator